MARKNIFEIFNDNNDIERKISRVISLFEKAEIIKYSYLDSDTLYNFTKYNIFNFWKQKGKCLDFDDFLNTIEYSDMKRYAEVGSGEDCINCIELVYNCWWLAQNKIYGTKNETSVTSDFSYLKEIMDDCLSDYNYKAYVIEDEEMVLIGEDKPDVTAVAEITKPETSKKILKYNHFALKGDISTKKDLLNYFASELEPLRPQLKKINSQLEDNIFFMFNNLNIRHNNVNEKNRNYRYIVDNMDNEELEKWYDELYQMILLAFLLLDNVEREKSVLDLRRKIKGS